MELLLNILLGISLASAAGFRIFIPLLIISIASNAGLLNLAEGFEWLGSASAMIIIIAAVIFELTAFLIPFFDNLLDAIAAPIAVTAGIIAMASSIVEMDPLFKWILAIIAGGGAAGLIQSLTTITRGASSITTAGAGNLVISITETALSLSISILAVFFPVIMGISIVLLLFWSLWKLYQTVFKRRPDI